MSCITCNIVAHLNGSRDGDRTAVQHNQGPSHFSAFSQATSSALPTPRLAGSSPAFSYHCTVSPLRSNLDPPLRNSRPHVAPSAEDTVEAIKSDPSVSAHIPPDLTAVLPRQELSLSRQFWPQSPELLHSRSRRERCPS